MSIEDPTTGCLWFLDAEGNSMIVRPDGEIVEITREQAERMFAERVLRDAGIDWQEG